MSAFSDVDTSFLNNINAEPDYTANESNIYDIRFQGSPLAEMSGTSNEIVTPICSRDPDTSDHSRKMTEKPTSSTPNEYNPIDDLLFLPEGGSHVANIPNEPDSPMVLSNNLP